MTEQHAAAATAPPPLADDGPTLDPSSGQDAFTALARGFIEAHGYLSDEGMLAHLGLVPHAPALPL